MAGKPQEELPRSPGNEGARGSHGQANRGAQGAESTNEGGDARLPGEGREELRDSNDSQGGGGISSNSSRSRDI
jgi:hypothetical protein